MVINVTCSLSGSTWAAGQDVPLMICSATIRSSLDYCCLCCGTTAQETVVPYNASFTSTDGGNSTGDLAINTGNAVHN